MLKHSEWRSSDMEGKAWQWWIQ